MQRPEVFRELRPNLSVARGPEIARDASGQLLATIVDLDQLLPAVMAAIHTGSLERRDGGGAWAGALTYQGRPTRMRLVVTSPLGKSGGTQMSYIVALLLVAR